MKKTQIDNSTIDTAMQCDTATDQAVDTNTHVDATASNDEQPSVTANKSVADKKRKSKVDKQKLKEQRQAQLVQLKEKRHLAKIAAKAKRQAKLVAREQALPEDVRLANKLEAIANLQRDNKKWYKLDNAALMYPLVARGESISIFRVSALLKDPVDPVELQYAVNDIAPRFPTICGCVKNGLFWPFIAKPTIPILVKPQTKVPGRPMKVDSKHSQIRVNYIGNQISVEFFHSATDGTGGIIFLNSLLRRYFQRIGHNIVDTENCFDYRDIPALDEIRDNFANVTVKKNPPPCPKVYKSKIINGTLLKNKKYVTVRGVMSAAQLKQVAKQHNATVTEFLGAIQLLALNRLAAVTNSAENPPIRILVPVNLRKIYNVDTVRNFSSYIFYQYNGQSDIDEIIADLKQQTAEQMTDDYFRGMVSFNYNNGNTPLLRIVPLGVKRFVLSCIVAGRGDGIINCSTISNLGIIHAPKEFADLVVRYDFMLGKPARKTNNFAVATYNDNCVVSMTNPFAEHDCEKYFFSKLAEMGIDVAIESDIWEDEE